MPLELRYLVIGTVGAMNKHKMTLMIMGGENVNYAPSGPRDEMKGRKWEWWILYDNLHANRVHVCDVKRRKQPQK
jgi:hypothetical protein